MIRHRRTAKYIIILISQNNRLPPTLRPPILLLISIGLWPIPRKPKGPSKGVRRGYMMHTENALVPGCLTTLHLVHVQTEILKHVARRCLLRLLRTEVVSLLRVQIKVTSGPTPLSQLQSLHKSHGDSPTVLADLVDSQFGVRRGGESHK